MSNVIKNSLFTKFVAGFVGIATAVMMMGLIALPSQAQSISDLQAQINQLLATIAQLQAQISGGATSGGGTGYTFTQSLSQGDTGEEVRQLQKALNANGAIVASSGAGSPGNESTYFGSLTKAAVSKFQEKYASEILTPLGLSGGTGYWGASSRAKMNTLSSSSPGTGPTTTVPITGNLNVSLSPATPPQGVVIAGQGVANLASFMFANGASSPASVTKVTLKTEFFANDTTYSNVYLYDGGVRLTDAASVTNSVITFNDAAGLFTVPAGISRTLSVRADIAANTAGQIVGVSLTGVETNVPVSGAYPIKGNAQSIASATLATVDFNTTTEPSNAADVEPNNDVRLWQNTVNVSQNDVNLVAMSFRNTGSSQVNEIINFDLYVDGNIVASKTTMDSDRYVRFDFTSSPVLLETASHIIKLEGDIVGGSSRTYDFELRTTGDALFVDAQLNQAVVPTANGSTFSARSGGVQTIASSTGGTVTVSKANSSPLDNVSIGATNIKFATFEFRASGERMKIENLDVNAATANAGEGGLDNGRVFVNGNQVGSTKDLTEATDVNFTFGSSFIIEAGQTAIVDIYADSKTTTGTNLLAAGTVAITLGTGASNAQGVSSLQTSNVPSSDIAANTLTVASATASVTKFTGYGDQTRPAGTNNLRVGSFVISAGSTEGTNVNTIVIDLSANEAATVTNMRLVNNANGQQMGTTKNSPSTTNSYSVNLSIPKSGTQVIDIFADVKSGANAGPWIASFSELTGNGSQTGTTVSVTDDTVLQTITIGSGSLSVAVGPGDPNSDNVIAGSTTSVKVGEFRFSAANSSYTVQELAVKTDNDDATSVSAVKLRYKNSSGSTLTTLPTALTLPTSIQPYATATFTGLSMYVPANDDAVVEVLIDTTSTTNGAKSGAAINVTLDWDDGFKAVDSAGTQSTSVGSADVAAGGTFYPRKSIPTFAKNTLTGSPSTGNALYEFTVTADQAGSIEIKTLTFDVATSGDVKVTAFYLREKGQSVDINDTDPNADQNADVLLSVGLVNDSDVISIAAGQSKTFQLFGTVSSWGGATADTMNISFVEDASFVANNSSETLKGSHNLIWSDRSATSHTTITTDWTNGYLIDDFGGDVQSYSAS